MQDEAKIYNEMFLSGGYEGVYNLPYHHQCYYPLFKAVLSELKKINKKSVLEVGCGTGSFGQIVRAKTDIEYRGFDFSDIAVKKAKQRSDKPSDYFVGNAVQHDTYVFADFSYDCMVCTEVLEHIEEDITVIKNWKTNVPILFSVPNFDSNYHVRFFKNEQEIIDRYGGLLSIQKIKRIKKPYLANIYWKNVLKHLIWNRYRPKIILNILGLGSFDIIGGWFLVIGEKK